MKTAKLKKLKPDASQLKISKFFTKAKPDPKNDSSCSKACPPVVEKRVPDAASRNLLKNGHKESNKRKFTEVNHSSPKKNTAECMENKESYSKCSPLKISSANQAAFIQTKTSSPDLFASPTQKNDAKKKRLDFKNNLAEPEEKQDEILANLLGLIEEDHSTRLKSIENIKVEMKDPVGDEMFKDDLLLEEINSSFIENTPPLTQNVLKPGELRLNKKKRLKLKETTSEQLPTENVEVTKNEFLDLHFSEDGFDEALNTGLHVLDLSICLKCIVHRLEHSSVCWEACLTLKSIHEDVYDVCLLRGVWVNIPVDTNDVVTVKAKSVDNTWVVDSDYGFVCLSPHIIVSSTALSGAMFCRRKSVFTTLFKSIEAENKYMVLGKLVHEILQICLEKKLHTLDDIEAVLCRSLESVDTLRSLYFCNMSVTEVRLELSCYKNQIYNFISDYILNNTKNGNTDVFQGRITEIVDIEENVIAPRLGIKGRIDVSVKIHSRNRVKRIPLELKTGKASFSHEHRSQVVLYTIMLSEYGEDVNSGLLLYLKEGLMKEIIPNHKEKRDLLLLRNDLVQYLNMKSTKESKDGVLNLPDPISIKRACEKCPYLTLCSTFVKTNSYEKLSSMHHMKDLAVVASEHLSQKHIDYFLDWCRMVLLESKDSQRLRRTDKEENDCEKQTHTIELHLEDVKKENGVYLHSFHTNEGSLLKSKFVPGYQVILSTKSKFAISTGQLVEVLFKKCVIMQQSNIKDNYPNEIFTMELVPTRSFLDLTNLGILIESNERSNRLRELIIDQLQPTFDKQLQKSVVTKGVEILASLNENQQRAALKILAANDYVLIKGMPGCGKTQTIVAVVKLLVTLGKSVFITSHTHSAVDNVLLRLKKEQIKFLRLGSEHRVHSDLKDDSDIKQLCSCKSIDDVKNLYENCLVVGATCLANHELFSRRTFDYCLVDESTQIVQSEVIGPLFFCKKFALIGDPNQLRPVVRSIEARKLGMDVSLFSRLEIETNVISLFVQYRMNRVITNLANKLTYNDQLKCANDEIAESTLKGLDIEEEPWLSNVLSKDIKLSVIFVDTCDVVKNLQSKISEDPFTNKVEAVLTSRIVKSLEKRGIHMEDIGIIATYRAQVYLLHQNLNESGNSKLEINTVDQFQGRDKEVIIYSCTKNNNEFGEHEILNDQRRLTVAVTRAKHKLVLIGDKSKLAQYSAFARMFEILSEEQTIKLSALEFTYIET